MKLSVTINRLARHLVRGVAGCLVLVPALLCSCGNKTPDAHTDREDILVVVSDSALRLQDVLMKIPTGLAPEDSARLFHVIVNSWVDDRLLESVAVENLDDMEKIESLVADYRRKLIAESYKRKMRQSRSIKVNEDSVRSYIRYHKEELILDEPLVKGIYLKIPETSSMLTDVRNWVFSGTPDAVDNIEKHGVEEAVQYDYFGDRWVEFSSITELIPYRFSDANLFLQGNRNFETRNNGNVYLLHILDYIPSGREMPDDYARMIVSERFRDEYLGEYEKKLIKEIRQNARRSGSLVTPGYDLDKMSMTLPGSSKSGVTKKSN